MTLKRALKGTDEKDKEFAAHTCLKMDAEESQKYSKEHGYCSGKRNSSWGWPLGKQYILAGNHKKIHIQKILPLSRGEAG